MSARIKTPFIGTLLFSAILYNYENVIIFLLSKTEQQVELVKGYSPDRYDFIWIAVYTLLYLVCSQFIAPKIQDLVDKLKLKFIDKKRFRQRTERLRADYVERKKSNLNLVKSGVDYLREVATKELATWVEDRAQFEAEVASLKQELTQTNAYLNEKSQEVELLTSEIKGNIDYKKINKSLQEHLTNHNHEHYIALKKLFNSIGNDETLAEAIPLFNLVGSTPTADWMVNLPPGDEQQLIKVRDCFKMLMSSINEINQYQVNTLSEDSKIRIRASD